MSDLVVLDYEPDGGGERLLALLRAFNTELFGGPNDARPLFIPLDDGHGTIEGGMKAVTVRGWLIIEALFVPEARRRQGLARRMLAAAEAEAIRRGCRRAMIDTANPVALRLYEKAGYKPFGRLADFAQGRDLTYLSKPLAVT